MKKCISGEIIAYQLADKLCELNGWASRSGQHNIAEIRFRECIERGIAAGKITPHCPVTFTKLSLDNRLFEDATFSEQEVMDYLNSELPRGNEWYAKPDWLHWFKGGYVDAWQGTALAHDLDPVTYTEPINTNQRAANYTIMPPDVRDKYRVARQHFGDRELMPLKEFATWAQEQGWILPSAMLALIGTAPAEAQEQGGELSTAKARAQKTISLFLVEVDSRAKKSEKEFSLMAARDSGGFYNTMNLWAKANNHATLRSLGIFNEHRKGMGLQFSRGRPPANEPSFYKPLFPELYNE